MPPKKTKSGAGRLRGGRSDPVPPSCSPLHLLRGEPLRLLRKAPRESNGLLLYQLQPRLLNCIWHPVKANATAASVIVRSAWEEGLREWRAMLSANGISWLVANTVRKSAISLEAVNRDEPRIRRNAFTSCPSTGKVNWWGIVFLTISTSLLPQISTTTIFSISPFSLALPDADTGSCRSSKQRGNRPCIPAGFVPWLNDWGDRASARAGGGLRKLQCRGHAEGRKARFQHSFVADLPPPHPLRHLRF